MKPTANLCSDCLKTREHGTPGVFAGRVVQRKKCSVCGRAISVGEVYAIGDPSAILVTNPAQPTPVEKRGDLWFKRDDFFKVHGVRGGKVRTCLRLAKGAKGIVCAASRQSPQLCYAAAVARGLGITCKLFTPSGEPTPEMKYAEGKGAIIRQIAPGYNNVIAARAREEAESLKSKGFRLVPFGMECQEAVEELTPQVVNLPKEAKRLVVVAGSGMTLSGILRGMTAHSIWIPILGVIVGASPEARLDNYAPGWRSRGV